MADNILEKFHVDSESTSGFFHEVFFDIQADENENHSLSYTIGFVPRHRFEAKFRDRTTQDYVEYGINRAELRVNLNSCEIDTAKTADGGTLSLTVDQNFTESLTQGEKRLVEDTCEGSGELTGKSGKLAFKAGQKSANEENAQEVSTVHFQYCHITTTANFNNPMRPTWVFLPKVEVLEGMLPRRHLCHIYKQDVDDVSGESCIHLNSSDITIYSFPQPPSLKHRISGLGKKWMERKLIDLIIQKSKKTQPIKARKW